MPRRRCTPWQTELTGALRQRERLAQLGEAVAKISHDLRKHAVGRHAGRRQAGKLRGSHRANAIAPKLVSSLNRAINLTEATLAFGRAEEPAPKLDGFRCAGCVLDVIENDQLAGEGTAIAYRCDVPADIRPACGFRGNCTVSCRTLVRNARQAIASSNGEGTIRITGRDTADGWVIEVCDTGTRLAEKRRLDHLFKPFHGGARKGWYRPGPCDLRRTGERTWAGSWSLARHGPRRNHLPRQSCPAAWRPDRKGFPLASPGTAALNPALTHR